MIRKFKILILIGTRPEAIKIAPLIKILKANNDLDVKVCVTAQHRELLDDVLHFFAISPDFDLDIMKEDQNLTQLTSRLLTKLGELFRNHQFHLACVHGDTTTTMSSSLAAFYAKVPVAHIEAGLRTNNIYSPWPEELNRQITGRIATLHFAPTITAMESLVKEGIDKSAIFVTGNTVIDSLNITNNLLDSNFELLTSIKNKFSFLSKDKKLILITAHRRENFGLGIENICTAIKVIANRSDIQIIFSVHPNPSIKNAVFKLLNNIENVFLIEPPKYYEFVYLMKSSFFIITDSGGIQEEAPAFGIPVLITRSITERPEGIESGNAKIVGNDTHIIITESNKLLTDCNHYRNMSIKTNVYGSGEASTLICNGIRNFLLKDEIF